MSTIIIITSPPPPPPSGSSLAKVESDVPTPRHLSSHSFNSAAEAIAFLQTLEE